MKSACVTVVVLSLLIALSIAPGALAWHGDAGGRIYRGQYDCWHRGYAYTAWGRPTALVVPPTADYQTHWGWGVGNTRVTRIWPQFKRDWPGSLECSGAARTTPQWPSDTDQFGVNYVRGPW